MIVTFIQLLILFLLLILLVSFYESGKEKIDQLNLYFLPTFLAFSIKLLLKILWAIILGLIYIIAIVLVFDAGSGKKSDK
jgi:hypothetical protein